MRLNILVSVLILVILGMLYLYADFPTTESDDSISTNELPFDQQEWQKGNERSRGAMANDIIESDTLIKHPESKVLSLLGAPDMQNDSLLIYNIDMGDEMSISGDNWPYNLIIRLSRDTSSRVEEVMLAE
ncbi:MAG: hypothetical protein ACQEST_00085 [Bacteroidota bacterium]